MMMAVLISGLLATSPPVAFVPTQVGGLIDGHPFSGGIYDGLNVGMVSTPDGKEFRGLLASQPGASPVSTQDLAAINAYVAGIRQPDVPNVSQFLKPGLIIENCRQQGQECDSDVLMPVLFAEPVHINTPYRLEDGTVRVEWLYGNAIYYLTFLHLKGGKIVAARTQPAWLPNVIAGGH